MHTLTAQQETPPAYGPGPANPLDPEGAIIAQALGILLSRLKTGPVFTSPQTVKDYTQLRIGGLPHEVFCVMFLNAQHELLHCEEMFRGTLTQTSVYPREVAKEALMRGASAVILAHNHPSGCLDPSSADELLTQSLKSSLSLLDVRVLDHLVVSPKGCTSFAERGLL